MKIFYYFCRNNDNYGTYSRDILGLYFFKRFIFQFLYKNIRKALKCKLDFFDIQAKINNKKSDTNLK